MGYNSVYLFQRRIAYFFLIPPSIYNLRRFVIVVYMYNMATIFPKNSRPLPSKKKKKRRAGVSSINDERWIIQMR